MFRPFQSVSRARRRSRARRAWAALLAAALSMALLAACSDRDAARRSGNDARGRPMRLAAAAEAAQDWDAAIAHYETALRHRPDMAAAHRRLAVLLQERRQDIPGALHHYLHYQTLAPDATDREELAEAIDACNQYIAARVAGDTSAITWQLDDLRAQITDLQRQLAASQDELRSARAQLEDARAAASAARGSAPALRAPSNPPPRAASANASSPSPRLPAAASPAGPRTHLVRSGDTLGKIAKTYGVTVDAIYQANRGVMRSPNELRVGVTLVIPAK